MRILVTGAGGLLGTEVVRAASEGGHEVAARPRADLDVTDPAAVRAAVERERPQVVVHCAAYTAVDAAEEHADEAMRVNRDGAETVARAAASAGALVVLPSTDFVFDGRGSRPYRPDDAAAPASAYGRSKWEGERAVAAAAPQHLVVRTSWLYGRGGRNFVDAVVGRAERGEPLRVVADQRGRPTWARNLARTILELVAAGARGVWHAADGGEATWFELAVEALRLEGLDVPVTPVTTAEWGAPAPRPAYSVLDLTRTEALVGHPMMPWREALAGYLAERRRVPPIPPVQ